jgi:hypothetical protein
VLVRDTDVVPYLENTISAFDFHTFLLTRQNLQKRWVAVDILSASGDSFKLSPKEIKMNFDQAIMEVHDRVEMKEL